MPELRVGEQVLHRLGHHVRGRVAQDVAALGAVDRDRPRPRRRRPARGPGRAASPPTRAAMTSGVSWNSSHALVPVVTAWSSRASACTRTTWIWDTECSWDVVGWRTRRSYRRRAPRTHRVLGRERAVQSWSGSGLAGRRLGLRPRPAPRRAGVRRTAVAPVRPPAAPAGSGARRRPGRRRPRRPRPSSGAARTFRVAVPAGTVGSSHGCEPSGPGCFAQAMTRAGRAWSKPACDALRSGGRYWVRTSDLFGANGRAALPLPADPRLVLGGRYWVRTSDLFGVNEARYHCANRPAAGSSAMRPDDARETLAQRGGPLRIRRPVRVTRRVAPSHGPATSAVTCGAPT